MADFTPVTKAEMMMDRLEFPEDFTIKFVRHDGTRYVVEKTLTMTDDWSLVGVSNLYINVDFQRFLVLDFVGFETILANTEYVVIEGIAHKLMRKTRPFGYNRVWEFKLEPINDFSISGI